MYTNQNDLSQKSNNDFEIISDDSKSDESKSNIIINSENNNIEKKYAKILYYKNSEESSEESSCVSGSSDDSTDYHCEDIANPEKLLNENVIQYYSPEVYNKKNKSEMKQLKKIQNEMENLKKIHSIIKSNNEKLSNDSIRKSTLPKKNESQIFNKLKILSSIMEINNKIINTNDKITKIIQSL
jgi:hypothetical protein